MTQPDGGLGYRTNPRRVGAPLPEEMLDISMPHPMAIGNELVRAQVELMYAIARHRQAWSAMRKYKLEQDARARDTAFENFLDSDPKWKIKTGDVAWWRGEMNAQAATVTALMGMLGIGESLEGYAETTNFDEQARGVRTFIAKRPGPGPWPDTSNPTIR